MTHSEAVRIANGGQGAIVSELRRLDRARETQGSIAAEREVKLEDLMNEEVLLAEVRAQRDALLVWLQILERSATEVEGMDETDPVLDVAVHRDQLAGLRAAIAKAEGVS